MARGCRTNEHILVSAGDAACQHERSEGHGKLSGEYSHETFVSFAVDRWRRDANLKTARAHARKAFRRGARTYAKMQDEVRALRGAPRLIGQATGTKKSSA